MRGLAIAICAALSVAGCVTAEQREAQISANDAAACQSYGAQPGMQAYFTCRMSKDQQRQAKRTALQAAVLAQPQPAAATNVYVVPYGQPPQPYLNTAPTGTGDGLLGGVNRAIDLEAARRAE